MSAVTWPDHLLTLDEWDALADDDTYRRAELVEGVLQMSPSPTTRHQRAQFALMKQLDRALTGSALALINDVDVVLTSSFPPTVRQPDVLVVPAAALQGDPTRLSAADVQLAVEITSPGSRRIDRVMKSVDYAEAGISAYWIVDLDAPVSIDAFELRDGRYEPVLQSGTGRVTLDRPCPVTLDLNALVPN